MINTVTASTSPPDYSDIQGLLLRGYTHTHSVHMIFQFGQDLAGIPDFFNALLPYLRSAEDWGPFKPEKILNIGLTANGLFMLNPTFNKNVFPTSFINGPQNNPSQFSLMDTGGPGDPSNWWNKKFNTQNIHCIVHAYAISADFLDDLIGIISTAASNSGSVTELKPMNNESGRLEQFPCMRENFIHFGYRDGIDNPNMSPPTTGTDPQDLNQFLIGYTQIPKAQVPAPTTPGPESTFSKNGFYNAFRILSQDTVTFDNYLNAQAAIVAPQIEKSVEYTVEWLAAKINGRWRNGSPLELSPDMPEKETAKSTKFGYDQDTKGLRCPVSSHTRVSNPRNESIFGPPASPPRLMRRGVPYGPPLDRKNAEKERGLIGLFLCGDFASQFELLYAWINNNNFSKLFPFNSPPQDALVANRPTPENNPDKVGNGFVIPINGKPSVVLPDLPQFVVTFGTAYTMFPSISSIKKLAGVNS